MAAMTRRVVAVGLAAILVLGAACSEDSGSEDRGSSATSSTGPAAAERSVAVSRGSQLNPAGCTSTECGAIVVELSGFGRGPHSAQLHCDECGETTTDWGQGLTGVVEVRDGENVTAYAFGFPGSHVWAVVGGIESNHLEW